MPFSLLWVCLLTIVGQAGAGGGDRPITIGEVASLLARREALTLESASVHIKCAWGATDHLLLNEADEKRLLEMMQRSEFNPQAFPRQTIMRTPGYRYEFGKKGSRLFQRVVNPMDLKFGEQGLTGAFDGTFGVELMQRDHATIEARPPGYCWQNWEYAFLQNLDILKYVSGVDRRQIPIAVRPIGWPGDLVESPGDYTVVGREPLDGVVCLVLDQTDQRRYWLDPALGYAIRRVDSFIPGKKRAPGSRRSSVTMSDFREVKPGLWLPWAITEELEFSTESGPPDLRGQPALRRTLAVESIEFDKLTDAFFEVPIPADTMVHDNIRNIQYRNQKDGIPFASAIGYAQQQPGRRPVGKVFFVVANLLLAVVLAWFYLSRRSSKTAKS